LFFADILGIALTRKFFSNRINAKIYVETNGNKIRATNVPNLVCQLLFDGYTNAKNPKHRTQIIYSTKII
jgi:hypothetical protein